MSGIEDAYQGLASRSERIEHSFRLGLLGTTQGIVRLGEEFRKRPPRSGDVIDFQYEDELTGEAIDLGFVAAAPRIIDQLRSYKMELVRHAISSLVETFEIFLEDLHQATVEVVWAEHTDRTLYDRIASRWSREPDEILRVLRRTGWPDELVAGAKAGLQVPTALRHLWTHRGVELDEQFFAVVGRQGQSPSRIFFLDGEREIELGVEFTLKQADVQTLAHSLNSLGRSICEGCPFPG